MKAIAKWAWIIVLIIFFVGFDIVWFIIVPFVLVLLVCWLKPEWLDWFS